MTFTLTKFDPIPDGEDRLARMGVPVGSTSTETNPSYTFTQKGMFQVKLTVADEPRR